jgi:hypothetical protein
MLHLQVDPKKTCKFLRKNLLCKVNFFRQNSLFQNTKEKFGGKNYFAKEQVTS